MCHWMLGAIEENKIGVHDSKYLRSSGGGVEERTTSFYNVVREVLAEVKVTFEPRHRGGEDYTDLWVISSPASTEHA